MTELTWDGKYKDGKKVAPVRIALPFQTIETVNESEADRQKPLLFLPKIIKIPNGVTGSFEAIKNTYYPGYCPNW